MIAGMCHQPYACCAASCCAMLQQVLLLLVIRKTESRPASSPVKCISRRLSSARLSSQLSACLHAGWLHCQPLGLWNAVHTRTHVCPDHQPCYQNVTIRLTEAPGPHLGRRPASCLTACPQEAACTPRAVSWCSMLCMRLIMRDSTTPKLSSLACTSASPSAACPRSW